jgi:hypothetical protein
VDSAAAEFRQAGYAVVRFPNELCETLVHPRDDFLEVFSSEGADADGVWEHVAEIASKYGALCDCVGPMQKDYVPFAWARD